MTSLARSSRGFSRVNSWMSAPWMFFCAASMYRLSVKNQVFFSVTIAIPALEAKPPA